MDKASVIGLIAGLALVLIAIILGGNLLSFVNLPGTLIVLGGTFAATTISFPSHELKCVVAVTKRVFNDPGTEMKDISDHLVESLKVMKKEGHLALERMAEEAPTKPLRRGLFLIADGANLGTIRQIMQAEQRAVEEHHRTGQQLYSTMGKFSPAFGMIGTLIGLVQMLAEIDDPSNVGPSMAVALLTTLYGALLANLVFLPMVTKLDRRLEIELSQIRLATAGIEAVQQGETIAILQEKLRAILLEDDPEPVEETETLKGAA